jgi:hypothetical protein
MEKHLALRLGFPGENFESGNPCTHGRPALLLMAAGALSSQEFISFLCRRTRHLKTPKR